GLEVGSVPRETALRAYTEAAARDGRRLVVGASVTAVREGALVQHATRSRELLPRARGWVGCRAAPGEDAPAARRRGVRAATGWELATLGLVVELIDWEAGGVLRREVDVVVTVRGALDAPVLEAGKHDEWRWVGRGETSVLDEGRAPEDVWLRGVVE